MLDDLVILGGYAGSGKDAFADILVAEHGYTKDFMSRPLLEAMLVINPWIHVDLEDVFALGSVMGENIPTVGHFRYRALYDQLGYDMSKVIKEVREFLQRLGTDFGRVHLGDGIWVTAMERRIYNMRLHAAAPPKVVVTGIRYPNELGSFRKMGCLALWVQRPGVEAVNAHSSDNTLTFHDFDHIIHNDGSLEDLALKAKAVAER